MRIRKFLLKVSIYQTASCEVKVTLYSCKPFYPHSELLRIAKWFLAVSVILIPDLKIFSPLLDHLTTPFQLHTLKNVE